MPRLPGDRSPAEPSSAVQRGRYESILRAAARLGAKNGLDRVQMNDVATDAGVAIATLYRYFPSKTVLFTEVMRDQVERFAATVPLDDSVTDPAQAICTFLSAATRRLLSRPLLAQAMMQSNNAVIAQHDAKIPAVSMRDSLLRVARIEDPSPDQERRIRILEQAWYGMVISALNGHITADDAEADTEFVCQLLIGSNS